MLPASNRGSGTNIGFPDVCNTIVGPATAPVPYPNMAMHAQATPFSAIVNVSMMGALNLSSKIPMTSGDEAGTAHPTIKGAGAFTAGNAVVFVEKQPAINLTAPTTGNSMNNPLGAVLVPATTNVFFTRARKQSKAETASPSLESLRHELEAPLGNAVRARCFGRIGVIRISTFSADVPGALQQAVSELQAQGIAQLIIDLRNNPGGELSACIRALGLFITPGTTLFEQEDADGDKTPIRARGAAIALELPLTLMVNRWTASAAELFAGALTSLGRAQQHGGATYGKTSAQTICTEADGTMQYKTAARYRFTTADADCDSR
jgi:carboxyl-terminal processing protease